MFDRLFGKKRQTLTEARHAELEGDLARAATLFAEAGRVDEAARVMVLRGDAEADATRRRQHYVQAAAMAEALPEDHAVRSLARRKRALLAIAAARDGATSAAARQDLLEAAADLEAMGEAPRAAEAYALAGDVDGEARALVSAGDVEKVEELLERDRARASDAARARGRHVEIERRLACGERRDALVEADALAKAMPDDGAAADRARSIRAARAMGPRVAIALNAKPLVLAIGDEVTVGRTDEATIAIASHSVSRKHLAVARDAEGRAIVRDLGSRNGTALRGLRIAGDMVIPSEGLEVRLGGEVPVRVAPSDDVDGAIAIDAGGARVVAPLGPARLGVGAWRLEVARDGWIELVVGEGPSAFLGPMQLAARTPLLLGDAIATSRGGEVVLRVGASP